MQKNIAANKNTASTTNKPAATFNNPGAIKGLACPDSNVFDDEKSSIFVVDDDKGEDGDNDVVVFVLVVTVVAIVVAIVVDFVSILSEKSTTTTLFFFFYLYQRFICYIHSQQFNIQINLFFYRTCVINISKWNIRV